jgi:hypothetical protein
VVLLIQFSEEDLDEAYNLCSVGMEVGVALSEVIGYMVENVIDGRVDRDLGEERDRLYFEDDLSQNI